MPFGPASHLGVSLFDETPPVEWVPNGSVEEADIVIQAVYRQVLGNTYVMDSERLIQAESQFKQGDLGVRGFVRAVAQSELYRSRFFTDCSRYRSIELNFRHLLGRPPKDYQEMEYHSSILDTQGFEAEIDSYVGSDEYGETFGENFVPYIRGYKTEACQSMVQFTHTFELVRGSCSSSLSSTRGNRARLNSLIIEGVPTSVAPVGDPMVVIKPGVPETPFGEGVRPVSRLGVSLFDETDPLEWIPGRSDEEAETIIRAVYRQVLGNAYVMESERLTVPESQFKRGELSVREFVRAVAKSDLYLTRFFTSCARYRAIELNFRHLLGRAPLDLEEMRVHSTILDTEGFYAEIDSYLDSDEYQDAFGENFVPCIRGYKTEACQSMVQFTHTFQLVRGAASSSLKGDIAGKSPKLNSLVIGRIPTAVNSSEGGGVTFRQPDLGARKRQGAEASSGGKMYLIEVTSYRANTVKRVSRFRRSNQSILVPFEELSATFQKIHKQGGVIASVQAL
jgi:phycoerythrin-associated linker protein